MHLSLYSVASAFCFSLQLAPNNEGNENDRNYVGVRWSQTYDYGFVPNDLLQRFFMAVAMDTPDFDGPHGS